MTANTPKVSVAMITYNHQHFIAQSIESVLMQQASFRVELVIGEDWSTDGTRQVVERFQQAFPDRVTAQLHSHNLGMHENFKTVLAACGGEYIALLEGDDYWTDPSKLEQQVSFLDSHPECALCFHNVSSVRVDGHYLGDLCAPNQKETSTIEDLLQCDFIPTCSIVFRRSLFSQLPVWTSRLGQLDWVLELLLAEQGNLHYIPSRMAVYRNHSGGVWSTLSRVNRNEQVVRFYREIDRHFGFKYDKVIRPLLSDLHSELVSLHLSAGDYHRARSDFVSYLGCLSWFQRLADVEHVKTAAKIYLPRPFRLLRGVARRLRSVRHRMHCLIKNLRKKRGALSSICI